MGYVIWGSRIEALKHLGRLYRVVLVIVLTGCASGKEVAQDHTAPFELVWAQAQPWVSGTPEGPSGMRLSFELSPPSHKVVFKSLCYMQQTAAVINKPSRPDEFNASYLSVPAKSEVVLQDCSLPELWQNEVKQPNQGVLVYEQDGVDYYYVIHDIVLKPVLAYPGKQ